MMSVVDWFKTENSKPDTVNLVPAIDPQQGRVDIQCSGYVDWCVLAIVVD